MAATNRGFSPKVIDALRAFREALHLVADVIVGGSVVWCKKIGANGLVD